MHINIDIGFVLLVSLFFIPNLAKANSAKYFYDRAGRLSRVVEPESGEIYSYDKLGNLLSVQQESISPYAPIITSITPDVIFVGGEYLVKLIGENFLSTESITSTNPNVAVNAISISDTEIIAEITASFAGVAPVIVSNDYGQASIILTISSSILTMNPERLILSSGEAGVVSFSINPPLSKEISLNLSNSNHQVVAVPGIVTIPTTGESSITVTALENGNSNLTAGDVQSLIIVNENYSGEYANFCTHSVSIWIDSPETITSPAVSSLLSVIIEGSLANLTFPALSKGASVRIEAPQSISSKTVSKLVSVKVQ